MDPAHFLALARQLVAGVEQGQPLTGGSGAAECRCAIGRAYYATFLAARALLAEFGVGVPPDGSAHTAVYFALNNSGANVLAKAAVQLRALYDARTTADYDTTNADVERVAEAESAVAKADLALTVFTLIRQNRVTPPLDRAAVADAIFAWAKTAGWEQKLKRRP
jgi:uncharacterized protein (UPF0332 family)